MSGRWGIPVKRLLSGRGRRLPVKPWYASRDLQSHHFQEVRTTAHRKEKARMLRRFVVHPSRGDDGARERTLGSARARKEPGLEGLPYTCFGLGDLNAGGK
jgi:hypothetical protein